MTFPKIHFMLLPAVLAACLSLSAYAQLTVKSKTEKPEKLLTLSFNHSELVFWNGKYALRIGGGTPNIPGILFGLGETPGSSISTLKDMTSVTENSEEGTSLLVEDAFGFNTTLTVRSMLGARYLSLERKDSRNHAYDEQIQTYVTPKEMDKAATYLSEKNAGKDNDPFIPPSGSLPSKEYCEDLLSVITDALDSLDVKIEEAKVAGDTSDLFSLQKQRFELKKHYLTIKEYVFENGNDNSNN